MSLRSRTSIQSILKDLKKRKENELNSQTCTELEKPKSLLTQSLRRAKEIYAEHFKNRIFQLSINLFDLFNKVEKEDEKPIMKLAEFCNQVAQEFEDNGQASSAHYYRYTGDCCFKSLTKRYFL